MNRIVFLLLFVFGVAGVAHAQQLVITVVEQNSGTPLPAMMVKVGELKGLTDMDGVLAVTPKSYPVTIEVVGMGYETLRQQVNSAGSVRVNVARKMNSMNETVVTGVARPTRLQNALSQYRVITRAENLAQGNITLADALATRLNISVENDNVLGSSARVQGMGGSKVKILIDGLPVNGREGGNVDMSQLNLNNVERIEIVQGPMSVVYGSDALGGVINLITRKTGKLWEANGGINYESLGKYNFDFAASRRWGKHQLSFGGGRNYFQGWNDIDTFTDNTPHRRLEWKPKEQYLANAAYNYTAKSGFKAQLASDFVKEKITNRGVAKVDAFGAYAPDEYYRTTRLNTRLIMGDKIGKNGRWESRNNYSFYYRERESVIKDLVSLNEILSENEGDQDTSRFDDINLRANYSNILGRLKYDAGYDVLLQNGRSGKIPDGAKFVGDYALYQNFSMAFLKDKLTLQASLRESYNTQYQPPLIYSFQALYAPIKKVQIRASYANGFRAPSLKEQYLDFLDQNHKIYGNPNLKAENGNHAQASISYQPYDKDGNYIQVIATGFYNDVTNLITLAPRIKPDSSVEYIYSNFAKMRNAIFNFQLEQQWSDLHVVLEYSFSRTFAQTGYYDAFNAMEYVARANYYWKKPAVTFNVFFKRTGKTANVREGIEGLANYQGELNAYNRMDASLERKFWKNKIQIIAGVKNIFDVQRIGGTSINSTGGGGHSSSGIGSFLPRTFFTTVRLNLN